MDSNLFDVPPQPPTLQQRLAAARKRLAEADDALLNCDAVSFELAAIEAEFQDATNALRKLETEAMEQSEK